MLAPAAVLGGGLDRRAPRRNARRSVAAFSMPPSSPLTGRSAGVLRDGRQAQHYPVGLYKVRYVLKIS